MAHMSVREVEIGNEASRSGYQNAIADLRGVVSRAMAREQVPDEYRAIVLRAIDDLGYEYREQLRRRR